MVKINPQVEAQNQEDSLISSSSLPDFEDIEKEYQEYIASLGKETPAAKKRGRRAVTQAEPEEEITPNLEQQFTAEQLEDFVCLPLDSWFVRIDKKVLSKIERKSFSIACARIANKWLPKVTSLWQEEIGLAICLASIFGSRMEIKKPMEKKVDETTKKEVPQADQVQTMRTD